MSPKDKVWYTQLILSNCNNCSLNTRNYLHDPIKSTIYVYGWPYIHVSNMNAQDWMSDQIRYSI